MVEDTREDPLDTRPVVMSIRHLARHDVADVPQGLKEKFYNVDPIDCHNLDHYFSILYKIKLILKKNSIK
jgi:hypothetical protein